MASTSGIQKYFFILHPSIVLTQPKASGKREDTRDRFKISTLISNEFKLIK